MLLVKVNIDFCGLFTKRNKHHVLKILRANLFLKNEILNIYFLNKYTVLWYGSVDSNSRQKWVSSSQEQEVTYLMKGAIISHQK